MAFLQCELLFSLTERGGNKVRERYGGMGGEREGGFLDPKVRAGCRVCAQVVPRIKASGISRLESVLSLQ